MPRKRSSKAVSQDLAELRTELVDYLCRTVVNLASTRQLDFPEAIKACGLTPTIYLEWVDESHEHDSIDHEAREALKRLP